MIHSFGEGAVCVLETSFAILPSAGSDLKGADRPSLLEFPPSMVNQHEQ
ncbi:hypothetical protein SAMN06264849_104202 [Melghirimyces algeriensis]|uniref:Uncharacterized protein n=1 Tax=Melghirimyces algeriensis TaxID=910412 RepID=A0A521CX44_9BACL|nr:hypothetical protein SAMN06264849_104202 [Melghirimyces algeriensis]